ncbi:hypothetical protein [Pontivivens ytuae]|uniref:Uncharacterized protein n=1 Tax=Pontivivens ytuae TaxID=2789856 RepID=A0A7S9LRK1_9RHOB|nr:hypothetical protein [Pontivivens ytuae]QPH53680.1 hypothetical protein I0K15_18160 [Pontivivens ytuae]
MQIRTFALTLAALGFIAAPVLAQGGGGCNWGAYDRSASAEQDTNPVFPTDDARG